MSLQRILVRLIAIVVLVATRVDSNAAMSIYTSSTSFAAAISSPGFDTFDDLLAGVVTPAPISRTAGLYGYSVSAEGGFFSAAAGSAHLAPNVADDPMQFGEFSSSVFGFALTLFGADIDGNSRGGLISIVATDSQGISLAGNVSVSDAGPGAFLGFVSDVPLASFIVAASGDSYPLWPTITMVTLASAGTVSPVPEPGTWLLLLAGASVLSGTAARRRHRSPRRAPTPHVACLAC